MTTTRRADNHNRGEARTNLAGNLWAAAFHGSVAASDGNPIPAENMPDGKARNGDDDGGDGAHGGADVPNPRVRRQRRKKPNTTKQSLAT
ncbi:hypothetical protein NP603_17605 [Methylomonas sp. SURF-1]|uniref:Uncharacterized protein n=1 Tax=Methylomonas aurea TaxID=2952224 RepID=A0ABT1UMM4_9GAMM|nr:hypothetical protein [Methylomonas sp. SURF-1]MCQ8182944.1 hypothetical protein [Methylomonas sp. SURF-1]